MSLSLASGDALPTNNNNNNSNDNNNNNNNRIQRQLTAPRTVSSTHAQVARAQSCANHVQHIERLSRATCRVPLGKKGLLSYQVWQTYIALIWALFYCLNY